MLLHIWVCYIKLQLPNLDQLNFLNLLKLRWNTLNFPGLTMRESQETLLLLYLNERTAHVASCNHSLTPLFYSSISYQEHLFHRTFLPLAAFEKTFVMRTIPSMMNHLKHFVITFTKVWRIRGSYLTDDIDYKNSGKSTN